jgi:hypothetical protein
MPQSPIVAGELAAKIQEASVHLTRPFSKCFKPEACSLIVLYIYLPAPHIF